MDNRDCAPFQQAWTGLSDEELAEQLRNWRAAYTAYILKQHPETDPDAIDYAFQEIAHDAIDPDELYQNLATSLLEFNLDPVDFLIIFWRTTALLSRLSIKFILGGTV